jgi:hypothetical protein
MVHDDVWQEAQVDEAVDDPHSPEFRLPRWPVAMDHGDGGSAAVASTLAMVNGNTQVWLSCQAVLSD